MRDDQVFDILDFPPGSGRIEAIVDHFVEVWNKPTIQPEHLEEEIPRPNKRRVGWGNNRNRSVGKHKRG